MTNLSIVGIGEMGIYNAQTMARRNYNLTLFDPLKTPEQIEASLPGVKFKIATDLESAVRDADIFLHCVPMDKVYDLLTEALPYCKPDVLVSGATSRKTPEAIAFDKAAGPRMQMVTMHDLFTPSKTKEPRKEIRAVINHKSAPESYQKALEHFGHTSNYITEFADVEEHDTITGHTQIKVSHTSLSIAGAFASAGTFPWVEGGYNHGLDVIKFSLAMRAASLPPHVYRNIQQGSPHGKRIISEALEAELQLDHLVATNQRSEYANRMNFARKKIFGPEFGMAILSDADVEQFNGKHHRLNSHASYMGVLYAAAVSGINPFDHFRATTPMHRSLWLAIDYLCNNKELWAESLSAPFVDKRVILEDMVFRAERDSFALAILQDSPEIYNRKHEAMTAVLQNDRNMEVVGDAIKKSEKVIGITGERVLQAKESGLFDEKRRRAA